MALCQGWSAVKHQPAVKCTVLLTCCAKQAGPASSAQGGLGAQGCVTPVRRRRQTAKPMASAQQRVPSTPPTRSVASHLPTSRPPAARALVTRSRRKACECNQNAGGGNMESGRRRVPAIYRISAGGARTQRGPSSIEKTGYKVRKLAFVPAESNSFRAGGGGGLRPRRRGRGGERAARVCWGQRVGARPAGRPSRLQCGGRAGQTGQREPRQQVVLGKIGPK